MLDAQRVEHAQRVGRHVGHLVGRAHAQPQALAQRLDHHVGHPVPVEALAQADVAVVVADDAKAALHQHLHQFVGPADQLHAQAHDQQHRFAVFRALDVDLDLQAVGDDLHQCAAFE